MYKTLLVVYVLFLLLLIYYSARELDVNPGPLKIRRAVTPLPAPPEPAVVPPLSPGDTPGSTNRVFNKYALVDADTTKYENVQPRGSSHAPGGIVAVSESLGARTLSSVIDTAPEAPGNIPIIIQGQERADARCGPSFGNAKCGAGRCCSNYGWCGTGTSYCSADNNNSLFNGAGAAVTQASPISAGPCEIDCAKQSVWESAKYYYDNAGEWKDSYVMRPTAAARASANQCDIAYEYRPKNNPTQQAASGTDRRRFTLADVGGCNWQAVSMGGYQSGTLVS